MQLLVVEMPGKCPKCGLRILKRTSKNGYTYYACEKLKECGFMTWDVPVAENCKLCSQTMFKTSGRGFRKSFCINESCEAFLPEDKRGYRKKPADPAAEETSAAKGPKTQKAAAKAASAAKPAKKKSPAKKTAAKKTPAKKTQAKKPKAGG
jgi:DNA topoisomerase-1